MSNQVLTLTNYAGLEFNVQKTPEFSTMIQRAVSGREVRVSERVYPVWYFGVSFSTLRDTPNVASPSSPFDELKNLSGFFLQRGGAYDSFLYPDPTDSAVTDQSIGTGDGNTTRFQLVRSYGGFIEPVENYTSITAVKDGGANIPPGAGAGKYTVSNTGVITFGTAPGAANTVTWTGSYYYRVRLDADKYTFNEFMSNLWELKKFGFLGSPKNQVL